jgi:hypothetical protein
MKKALFLLLITLLSLTFIPTIEAAKPRVRGGSVARKATGGGSGGGAGYSKAKLSRPTNSVQLTFMNLGSVKGISYTLSYLSGSTQQGAVGSFNPAGATTGSRDIYFGTCSHGVCTPHRNIKNAVLLVHTTLTSGKTHTKKYIIRL